MSLFDSIAKLLTAPARQLAEWFFPTGEEGAKTERIKSVKEWFKWLDKSNKEAEERKKKKDSFSQP